jgi:hypothetical protein
MIEIVNGGRQKGGRPGVGGDYPSPGSEMSNGFHFIEGGGRKELKHTWII